MAQIVVRINDHPYTMQCADGEEEHLNELAILLDTELSRIKSSVGQVGDIRLLVMTGLVVADKLSEALRRIEELTSCPIDIISTGSHREHTVILKNPMTQSRPRVKLSKVSA